MIVKDSRSPRGRNEGPHKTTSVLDLDFISGELGSGEKSWQEQSEQKARNVRGWAPRKKAA